MFLSFLCVNCIASVPLVKSHCAHDVVVGHGVEGVEGALDSLLGHQSHLPRGGHAGVALPVVVEDFGVFEAPGFEDD